MYRGGLLYANNYCLCCLDGIRLVLEVQILACLLVSWNWKQGQVN